MSFKSFQVNATHIQSIKSIHYKSNQYTTNQSHQERTFIVTARQKRRLRVIDSVKTKSLEQFDHQNKDDRIRHGRKSIMKDLTVLVHVSQRAILDTRETFFGKVGQLIRAGHIGGEFIVLKGMNGWFAKTLCGLIGAGWYGSNERDFGFFVLGVFVVGHFIIIAVMEQCYFIRMVSVCW